MVLYEQQLAAEQFPKPEEQHQLVAGHWHWDDWGPAGEEPGVLIGRISFKFDGKSYSHRGENIALIGMHALARWYQRSFHDDEATLLNDLGGLIRADVSSKRVDCLHGWWVCKDIIGPDDQMLMRVTTYKH
jgi:hypothetical protein